MVDSAFKEIKGTEKLESRSYSSSDGFSRAENYINQEVDIDLDERSNFKQIILSIKPHQSFAAGIAEEPITCCLGDK